MIKRFKNGIFNKILAFKACFSRNKRFCLCFSSLILAVSFAAYDFVFSQVAYAASDFLPNVNPNGSYVYYLPMTGSSNVRTVNNDNTQTATSDNKFFPTTTYLLSNNGNNYGYSASLSYPLYSPSSNLTAYSKIYLYSHILMNRKFCVYSNSSGNIYYPSNNTNVPTNCLIDVSTGSDYMIGSASADCTTKVTFNGRFRGNVSSSNPTGTGSYTKFTFSRTFTFRGNGGYYSNILDMTYWQSGFSATGYNTLPSNSIFEIQSLDLTTTINFPSGASPDGDLNSCFHSIVVYYQSNSPLAGEIVQNPYLEGNATTDSTNSEFSSQDDEFNSTAEQYNQLEDGFTDDFERDQAAVNESFTGWSWGALTQGANYIATSLETLYNNSGDFRQFWLFPLLLGVALVFLGRWGSVAASKRAHDRRHSDD